MRCLKCEFENPEGMKFCGQCATSLLPECPQCRFENPRGFKYCGQCGTPLIALEHITPRAQEETSLPTANSSVIAINDDTTPHAERRQLTVLFCDVVGSAALSEIVDPEDLRDIMGEYRDTCHKVVAQDRGYIAQYLGDGILSYFGYPQANEDDAIRAVECGLNLIENIQQLNVRLFKDKGLRLSIRIGIHTGLVVVGEIGSTDKRSIALGTTPNVAARLQDLANPDTVLISEATYRLVHTKFMASSIGQHNLKGFSHPFNLYIVNQARPTARYDDDAERLNQVPLIGREQEAALIADRLDHARSGQGQVVMLSGEAGIGKSRLVQLLKELVNNEENVILECWGSPNHKHSYLHCVIGLLQEVLQLDQVNNIEEKISKIEAPLATFGIPLAESVPLIAQLLSIPLPEGRYPQQQLTPQTRKQKTLESLLSLVMGLAGEKMVVVIIEDLHWMDPTTIELLGMLIDQAPTSNIFLLLSYRLEFIPPWAPRSHITHISINRLTRRQSGRMIRWIANNKYLPVALFNEILNKTDGTPFFVEELTKMVLESGLLRETHEHFELNRPLSSLAIPSTLQDSLMARLDRLGTVKELAQLSATLGRDFAYTLLRAITNGNSESLDQQLNQLVSDELLYQHGLLPTAHYTFRHALVHEVAYQSLLKKTRQKYHRKIADVLATQFLDNVRDNPEILAHHCYEAGDYQNALQNWLRAGRMAIQHSAHADATSHLSQALLALDHLPDDNHKLELELQIQASLGLAFMLLKGYAADEVQSAYARAYELCQHTGRSSTTFPILCGLWEYYLVKADLDTAQDLAEQIQVVASETANSEHYAEAQRTLGVTSFWRGDITNSEHHLQNCLARSTPDIPDRIPIYGQDTQVAALASYACVAWLLGRPDQAQTLMDQSVTRARQIKHPYSIVYATYFSTVLQQLCGNTQQTLELAENTLQLSSQYEFLFWRDLSNMLKLWAEFSIHNNNKHIAKFEKILSQYVNSGSLLASTYMQTLLAKMFLSANRISDAERILNNALNSLNKRKEHFFQAEIFCLKGVVCAHQDNKKSAEAETYFKNAIDLAQQQNAMGLNLRCTIAYARFLAKWNRQKQAQQLLDDILIKITEGRSLTDYQQAIRLREELEPPEKHNTQSTN